MKELMALICKSRPLILTLAICAIIIAIGVSWALIDSKKVTYENGTVKFELTKN